MSRISRRSELSPSATRGSNAINLGRNSGVDMGRKAQPSLASGAIGITQEVTSIAGVSVNAGVNVDITPLDFGISVNPSEGTVSVATGAEIPGGLLGISGGIEIDMNTGEIIGGSIGGEVAGLGINISKSKEGGLGIEFTVQIPGTPIEFSLGLGFPPEPKTPTSSPPPQPSLQPINLGGKSIKQNCSGGGWEIKQIVFNSQPPKPAVPELWVGMSWLELARCGFYDTIHNPWGFGKWWEDTSSDNILARYSGIKGGDAGLEKRNGELADYWLNKGKWQPAEMVTITSGEYKAGSWYWDNSRAFGDIYQNVVTYRCTYKRQMYRSTQSTAHILGAPSINNVIIEVLDIKPSPLCPNGEKPSPDNEGSISGLSPFPNPPPRKINMDICCRTSIQLQRLIVRHIGAARNTPPETLPNGVEPIGSTQDGIGQAFPFKVKKKWVDPTAKEEENFQILNARQLSLVLGGMIERLENVLGTAEFYKDSQQQLRQSEIGTLKWLTQRVTGLAGDDFTYPDPNDFWFNSDDGVINEKKVEVKSIADAMRYLVESQNRLERILPVAEIKNSTIPARWVYPGKKGQLRVGNLIHLVEYMFRADDRARGYWPQTVKIKDSNPAIKGDQPIELKFESQADMLREILKFLIDTESDGDLTNNFALRSAIQGCQIHQSVVQIQSMVDAMVEYLDFKTQRTTTKVPMPFSPFAGHEPSFFDNLLTKLGFGNKQIPGSIDKNTEEAVESLFEGVLQNTEVEVAIIEADEKKSLSEALMEILKHASAASAAVSERVGEGALKRLVDSAGIAQAVSRFLLKRDIAASNGIGDLDQWISSAESGYTDKPETESLRFPESNPLEPYNRPVSENPRIREIDTKNPKAD